MLFNILDVPPILLHFLWSWHKDQSCTFKWNSYVSDPFGVTNGVRQGGVLSLVLVYLEQLLQRLSTLDIGCPVGHRCVGSLCYLLMILPFLLPEFFSENVKFSPLITILSSMLPKTQLICFESSPNVKCTGKLFLLWSPSRIL